MLTETDRLNHIRRILIQQVNLWTTRTYYGTTYNHNIGIDISNTDAELFSSIAFNTKGTGSNSCSYDHVDHGETKKICLIQPKLCKTCKENGTRQKVHFLADTCPKCNGTDFEYQKDSRANIDTVAHFRDKIPVYRFWIFTAVEEATYKLSGYVINGNNPFFNEILTVQHLAQNKKKNLLPNSLEFYFSEPKLFATFVINVDIESIDTQLWCPDSPIPVDIPKTAFGQRKEITRNKVFNTLGEKDTYTYQELLEHNLIELTWKSPVNKTRGTVNRRD